MGIGWSLSYRFPEDVNVGGIYAALARDVKAVPQEDISSLEIPVKLPNGQEGFLSADMVSTLATPRIAGIFADAVASEGSELLLEDKGERIDGSLRFFMENGSVMVSVSFKGAKGARLGMDILCEWARAVKGALDQAEKYHDAVRGVIEGDSAA